MLRAGSVALVLLVLAGCGGGERAGKMGDGKHIRKQVGELTAADLQRHPVWEFALDEEGEPGQDEETVRPFADVQDVDLEEGLYVVATSFEAADGSHFSGYSSPHQTANVGYIQPTII